MTNEMIKREELKSICLRKYGTTRIRGQKIDAMSQSQVEAILLRMKKKDEIYSANKKVINVTKYDGPNWTEKEANDYACEDMFTFNFDL